MSVPKTRKRPPLLRTLSTLLAVALPICIVLCGAMVYRLFLKDAFTESRIVTVPDLTGRVFESDALPNAELYQIVRIDRNSAEPSGTVIAQSPCGGSERKITGTRYVTLTLYVSKGPARATVPSLVGASAEDGESELLRLGLAVKRIEAYSDTARRDTVITQSHAAGTDLACGETVTLTVSRGAAVRKAILPSLTGLSSVRAKSLLGAIGFKVGNVRYADSHGEEDVVLSQSPLPGVSLPEGARVELVLSKRPQERPAPPETDPSPETTAPNPREPQRDEPPTADKNEKSTPDEKDPEGAIDRFLERFFENISPKQNQTD